MLIVRATRKLLAHIGPPGLRDGHRCTTQLGEWYATVLPWRPRITLLVNEATLLPVLMPLAPAAAVGGEIVAWTRVTLETLRDRLRDREWTFCPCGEQHGQTETDDAVLAAVGADLLLLPAVSTPRP